MSGNAAFQGLEAPDLDDEKSKNARQHLSGEYERSEGSNKAQLRVECECE